MEKIMYSAKEVLMTINYKNGYNFLKTLNVYKVKNGITQSKLCLLVENKVSEMLYYNDSIIHKADSYYSLCV